MHSPFLKVKPEDSHGQQTVPILTRIKTEVIKHEKNLSACRMFEHFYHLLTNMGDVGALK